MVPSFSSIFTRLASNNQAGLVGIELEQVLTKVSVRSIRIKKLPVPASLAETTPAVHDSIAGSWNVKPLLDGMEMSCNWPSSSSSRPTDCSGDGFTTIFTCQVI